MADNEKLRGALEVYLQQKQDKLEEVSQLDQIISRLRRDLGETMLDAESDKDKDSSNTGISEAWQETEFGWTPPLKDGGKANVRPDEFFGMTYSTAAEAYLNKVKHAVSMDELLDALNRGGCPVGGREPRKTLYISLIRDVRTFVPIAGRSGFLGLRKFYPNLKALKEKDPKAKHTRNVKRKRQARKKQPAKAVVEGKAKHSSSAKQKSPPAADRTAQKGETM